MSDEPFEEEEVQYGDEKASHSKPNHHRFGFGSFDPVVKSVRRTQSTVPPYSVCPAVCLFSTALNKRKRVQWVEGMGNLSRRFCSFDLDHASVSFVCLLFVAVALFSSPHVTFNLSGPFVFPLNGFRSLAELAQLQTLSELPLLAPTTSSAAVVTDEFGGSSNVNSQQFRVTFG